MIKVSIMSEKMYTSELAGSGQFGRCNECKKYPIKEGTEVYDGCLGKLPPALVMNACCGHGDIEIAYVQFWDSSCIRGAEAVAYQGKLKKQQGSVL